MEKLNSISSISKNIFRSKAKKAENTCSNQSNPFGVSFKGKMITADVFETSGKESNIEKLTRRGKELSSKLKQSAFVGSINDFAANMSSRLNSVASFGRRIKNNISEFWNNAKNTNITFDMLNVKNLIKLHVPALKEDLSVKPVNELETMLNESIGRISA